MSQSPVGGRSPWRLSIWMGVLSVSVVVLVTNVAGRHVLPDEPLERIARLQGAGLPGEAEAVFEGLLAKTPLDLDLNYGYLVNHFEIPSSGSSNRDDDRVEDRYRRLLEASSSADVGHYGVGLFNVLRHDYPSALEHFGQVRDRDLKYLNNSIGRVCLEQGEVKEAEEHFQREIAVGGNLGGAVSNLAEAYLSSNRLDQLRALVEDERTSGHVTHGVRRALAFRSGHLASYAWFVFVVPLAAIRLEAGLAAALICLMWFVYFWRIDIFEQEPLVGVLAAAALGVISALGTTVVGDSLAALALDGGRSGSLLFYVLNVGLIEETVKLLPMWLVLKLSRQVNEPVDFVIYGSLSALGFATLENAHYFGRLGLGIVFWRFLLSTVLHMALTSIPCYAWAYAVHVRRRGSALLPVLGGLAAAALLHGLYDYFIDRSGFEMAGLVIVFVCAIVLRLMIRSSLGASPFFERARSHTGRLTNVWMMVSTAAVMLAITYLHDNFAYSTDIANQKLISHGWPAILSVLAIFGALGEISLAARERTTG